MLRWAVRWLENQLASALFRPVHALVHLGQQSRYAVQAVLQKLHPLGCSELGPSLRGALSELFGLYTQAVSAGFARHKTVTGSCPPNLGASELRCICSAGSVACLRHPASLSIMQPARVQLASSKQQAASWLLVLVGSSDS